MKTVAFGSSTAFMKRAGSKLIQGSVLICGAVFLTSSCGGGSSSTGSSGSKGSGQGSVVFSANSISFKVAGPFAQAPATQTITGTVSGVTSGTLYVTVVANNTNGFFTVSNVTIAGDSGQLGVIPAMPSTLNAGNFSGSVTVNVCLNDSTCKTGQLSGSPKTIPVSYDVGSGVDGDTVTPRVVPANAAGTVILRGAGFTGATSVSFGSSAASSISVVSDSEIDVSYPAQAAGTYPITINSGDINYAASLVAVAPPAFSQALIPYPSDVAGQNPLGIEYDAQRTALFILFGSNAPVSTLVRYAFDGNTNTWGSPTQISMANLQQVHLSPDGTRLLALISPDVQHLSMAELDPITMAQTNVTTVPNTINPGDTACAFALANDGNAVVSLSSGSGVYGFMFGTFSRVFTPMSDGGGCYPVASENGAVVELGGLSGHEFVTSSEMIVNSGSQTGPGATGDLIGDTFISGLAVENQSGQILGYLGNSPMYSVINWAGTRAYTYTPNQASCSPTLSTFDLTATPISNPTPQSPVFPLLGSPIALPSSSCPDTTGLYLIANTPDDAALFIAGANNLLVQPMP